LRKRQLKKNIRTFNILSKEGNVQRVQFEIYLRKGSSAGKVNRKPRKTVSKTMGAGRGGKSNQEGNLKSRSMWGRKGILARSPTTFLTFKGTGGGVP